MEKSLHHAEIGKIFVSSPFFYLLPLSFLKIVAYVLEWWIFLTACRKQSVNNTFKTNIHTILEIQHTALLEMQIRIFCRQAWKEVAKKAYRSAQHHHNCQDVDKRLSHISSVWSGILKCWWRNQSDCFVLHFHSEWKETKRWILYCTTRDNCASCY